MDILLFAVAVRTLSGVKASLNFSRQLFNASGKASFKYDMRRLSEILSFPRAWYRRSIARRLFLGDTTEKK